jgi:hypothetical protein
MPLGFCEACSALDGMRANANNQANRLAKQWAGHIVSMRWDKERESDARGRKFPWTVLGIAVLIALVLYFIQRWGTERERLIRAAKGSRGPARPASLSDLQTSRFVHP